MGDLNIKKLCTPAKIYLYISILAAIVGLLNNLPIMYLAVNLSLSSVWAYVLGLLCKKGYKNVSWFLVVSPYIIMFLVLFRIIRVSAYDMDLLVSKDQQNLMKM